MSNRPDHRPKARDAFRLASDLMMDLIGGMRAYDMFQQHFAVRPPREPVPSQVNRLCLFHLIITLSKWKEFYDRYRDVIPEDVRDVAKTLSKVIEAKGILDFRNKVVGHVWDEDARRALTATEIEQRLKVVLHPGLKEFMTWVNDPNDNLFPRTAASVIERVRDRIRELHSFTDADLTG